MQGRPSWQVYAAAIIRNSPLDVCVCVCVCACVCGEGYVCWGGSVSQEEQQKNRVGWTVRLYIDTGSSEKKVNQITKSYNLELTTKQTNIHLKIWISGQVWQ